MILFLTENKLKRIIRKEMDQFVSDNGLGRSHSHKPNHKYSKVLSVETVPAGFNSFYQTNCPAYEKLVTEEVCSGCDCKYVLSREINEDSVRDQKMKEEFLSREKKE